MKTIDYHLQSPCSHVAAHVTHCIDLIGPTGVFVALCPGWTPPLPSHDTAATLDG